VVHLEAQLNSGKLISPRQYFPEYDMVPLQSVYRDSENLVKTWKEI